jgi:hypothetical protein
MDDILREIGKFGSCLQGGLLVALNLLVVALPLIELSGAVSKPVQSCFGALLVRAGLRSAVSTTLAVPASDPERLDDAVGAEQAHTSQAAERGAESHELGGDRTSESDAEAYVGSPGLSANNDDTNNDDTLQGVIVDPTHPGHSTSTFRKGEPEKGPGDDGSLSMDSEADGGSATQALEVQPGGTGLSVYSEPDGDLTI